MSNSYIKATFRTTLLGNKDNSCPWLFFSDQSINGHCYYSPLPIEDLLLRAWHMADTQPCAFREQLRLWALESDL